MSEPPHMTSRPAAQLFTEAMSAMRRVIGNDAVYLAMIRHVEGWCIGERSWLQGVADQEAERAAAGERSDDHNEETGGGRLSLPLAAGSPRDTGNEEPTGSTLGPQAAVGNG